MILSEKRTYRAIFALVLLIAALTRFIDLGFKSFWIDEGTTAFIIRGTFESFLHPPGYFILARPLLKIFGQSDYTFRLLPAISGWLTILFIMLLSGELFKESRYRNLITIMAGAVAAVNPYMVAMSQENRMYCLIALFAVSSSYYLCKAINNELGYDKSKYSPWLWWALYSIIIIYGTYTHVFTFTILAAGNIFLLCLVVFGKLPIKFWRYIIVQAIIFAAYIPLAFSSVQLN